MNESQGTGMPLSRRVLFRMDIFDKTQGLGLVHLLRKVKLFPFFRIIDGTVGSKVTHEKRDLVMMGSNNYLGLTHDPRVIDASVEAVRRWGTGCTGSRFLNGNLALHEELEKELAAFLGYEEALVFASGFMANQGAITALTSSQDYIFSDSENHACIIEGCSLSKANILVYRHCDTDHLEELLKSVPLEAGKLIILDGVFSMTGHLAPFDKINELAKKYNARTYIDDAHGLGVVGPGGRGTGAHFGIQADVLMGTFSKSLASQGGFICASKDVIDWIKVKARTFMFSAALAPSSAAAALEALRILKAEPEIVARGQKNALYLKQKLDEAGFNTMGTETFVVPVFIGDDEVALVACQALLKMGVFTTPVAYPAVPRGQAIIRCSVMASHTLDDIEQAAAAFKQLAPMILKANNNPSKVSMFDALDSNPEILKQYQQKMAQALQEQTPSA